MVLSEGTRCLRACGLLPAPLPQRSRALLLLPTGGGSPPGSGLMDNPNCSGLCSPVLNSRLPMDRAGRKSEEVDFDGLGDFIPIEI